MKGMSKCIAIAILFLTSSCQMLMNGRPSHEDLKWTPIKNANKIIGHGVEIATPSGGGWEIAFQVRNNLVDKVLLRKLMMSQNHTLFGHLRVLGRTGGIYGNEQLRDFARKHVAAGAHFPSGQVQFGVDNQCTSLCSTYSFSATKTGMSNQGPTQYDFRARGYVFYDPKAQIVFEVMLSERYPTGRSSILTEAELMRFFRSFKFTN